MRTALKSSGEISLSAFLITTKVAPQISVTKTSRMWAFKVRDTRLGYQIAQNDFVGI